MLSQINFFNYLNKTRGKCVLTQIMPFIEPQRHERHHIRNLAAYAIIIVMGNSNMKHFKGYEQGSHDALKNNYNELVKNSAPYC